jgi:hypothetical protein
MIAWLPELAAYGAGRVLGAMNVDVVLLGVVEDRLDEGPVNRDAPARHAFAGEVAGNGRPLPLPWRSVCTFSGLNDEPSTPGIEGGRTHSFGQYLSRTGLQGGVPGAVRNPTNASKAPPR